MSALADAAGDYVALRRAVGYKLAETERLLGDFVAFMEAAGAQTVTVALATEWAGRSSAPTRPARRLGTIRGFAKYLQAVDPTAEVPPLSLLTSRKRRPTPHLYSDGDIAAILTAARALDPPLRAATTEIAVGLLAATGMRVGEVLRLNRADVDFDAGVLTVWFTKFGKSRYVPVAASTVAALAAYHKRRQQLCPSTTPALFVSASGTRLAYGQLANTFAELTTAAAVTTVTGRRPRLHDLRHSFAVRTLLGWYRDGLDVQALLPRLSTYLGHVAPASTYWYLSAAPELLAVVVERLEPTIGARP